MAKPLHQLTCKGARFEWTADCEESLNGKLASAPVLARFDRGFTLVTDTSICGLVAVLSQTQDDGKLHPIAFTSRALSGPEKNYGITDLETLAVVWAISHYHHYIPLWEPRHSTD